MNDQAPFEPADLSELGERLLSHAHAVIAMQDVYAGNHAPDVIAMRHDMDAGHALATGVKMAGWEADQGYRSTYYVLHTSPYWGAPGFREALERIACLGHEIGIHTDALAEALRTGGDPDLILENAIDELRGYGFTIRGVAGHGNPLCNRDRAEGEITFANDEQFLECRRPQEGEPDRLITRGNIQLKLRPRALADFGLDYEALQIGLPAPWRCSDSGGKWVHASYEPEFAQVASEFMTVLTASASSPDRSRQLHLLVHPDWWGQAFANAPVAAAA